MSYESLVAYIAQAAMAGRPMFEGPVSVTMMIGMPIPGSWSKKKQRRAAEYGLLPTTKPDIDNVEKIIFDGLNGVAWKDDVQVVDVIKHKRYAEVPGVVVSIKPATEYA